MPTILVADDEPTIRALVRAALGGKGYRVLEAENGPDALQAARSQSPDLILLDIALPGLSGLDVLRRLQEAPATAGTPVLLLTGLVRREPSWPVANGLISKPFSPDELARQVAQALERKSAAIS
ncbi:MAG: response regulator [Dehalococcoidia bacterium]|nr:response regulator [Dehalococcoidia bacterium]